MKEFELWQNGTNKQSKGWIEYIFVGQIQGNLNKIQIQTHDNLLALHEEMLDGHTWSMEIGILTEYLTHYNKLASFSSNHDFLDNVKSRHPELFI